MQSEAKRKPFLFVPSNWKQLSFYALVQRGIQCTFPEYIAYQSIAFTSNGIPCFFFIKVTRNSIEFSEKSTLSSNVQGNGSLLMQKEEKQIMSNNWVNWFQTFVLWTNMCVLNHLTRDALCRPCRTYVPFYR